MIKDIILSWGLMALFSGCSGTEVKSDTVNWNAHVPFVAEYEGNFTRENNTYRKDPEVLGALLLEESSGVAPSIKNSGKLWTHQDGGNGNYIYLIDGQTAEILCTYRVAGAPNIDWEDMETVLDPETGKSYIYISDTGDNDQKRTSVAVYRLEEPLFENADKGKVLTTDEASLERYGFQYSDGSKDTEGMFVDRFSGDIYLITKRDEFSRLYIIPYPYSGSSLNKAFFVGSLGFKEVSAATANIPGDKFIVRNRQVLFYWEKRAGEKVWEIFKRAPERLPYSGEVQGEAVCFDKDNNYYTTSEKAGYSVYPPVYKYSKKQ